MDFHWTSCVIGFLFGTAAGAIGTYCADTWTDIRRKRQAIKQRKDQFLKLKRQMPKLIAQFKKDLSKHGQQLIREFFLLPNRGVCLGGSQKHRLRYYEEDHNDLRCKIDLLETQGFLQDVTPGNTPIYRMTEEFVELLHKYA